MCEELDKYHEDLESMNDRDIRSLIEYLKHEYCSDKIGNEQYLQYLEFLYRMSNDPITRDGKIGHMIHEVKESAIRETGRVVGCASHSSRPAPAPDIVVSKVLGYEQGYEDGAAQAREDYAKELLQISNDNCDVGGACKLIQKIQQEAQR